MFHKDLTINHVLESWIYADAAARNGASGFITSDVGRIAFQTDTAQYFRLKTTSPVVWVLIGPSTPLAASYASLQTPQSGTVQTTSTTGIMCGLAVGHAFRPTASGRVLVLIDGTLGNTTGLKFAQAFLRYGSGTAPAQGAVPVGVIVGGSGLSNGSDPSEVCPLCLVGVVTGLSLSTDYWFDLQILTNTGGTAYIAGVSITAVELPGTSGGVVG